MTFGCKSLKITEPTLLKDLEEFQNGDYIGIIDVNTATIYATTDPENRKLLRESYDVLEDGEVWTVAIDKKPIRFNVLLLSQVNPNMVLKVDRFFMTVANRACVESSNICVFDKLTGRYMKVTSPTRYGCGEERQGATCTLRWMRFEGNFYGNSTCTGEPGRQTEFSAIGCDIDE